MDNEKDIRVVDEDMFGLDTDIDDNFDNLGGIDLSILDSSVGNNPTEISIQAKKWKKQYYIGYLGLNFLTIYKENNNILQLLVILNPDKNKLRFLIETLREHWKYVDSKIYNDNEISEEDIRYISTILNNVNDKIELLENLKNFIFPETGYINKDSDINLLQLLNDAATTRELVDYYKNCRYTDDNKSKLKNLVNSINIIVNMMDPGFFRDINTLNEYSSRNYQYSPEEREALSYIEAPIALMGNESVIKPEVNTDSEVLKRDTSRYYFKKATLDLINLYHSRVYSQNKPNLRKIVRYI